MTSVLELARAYAENMDGWRAEPISKDENEPHRRAYLVHDGERVRLDLHQAWQSDRLIIRPSFPYRHDVSGPRAESITVSMDRAPGAVARDILRRVVPAAIEGTRQWERNIAAADARQARVDQLRADLSAEFPDLKAWDGDEPRFDWRPKDAGDDWHTWGSVKLYAHYRFDARAGTSTEDGWQGELDLRGLTVDQVRRVVRALAAPATPPRTSCPVTVEALRDDWIDHPELSDANRAALRALDDERLRAALDKAFTGTNEQWWWQVLDDTRSAATGALLRDLNLTTEED